jgi:hypothetical protein
MDNLFEGLKEGDLEELVFPLISIDEYDSKLDDDSIVIAFFVQDKDPAQDLNRFIQKGATAILDTDVSPAPNEEGYYLVFVELLRDSNFPKKVTAILDSLNGLTGIKSWKGTFYETGEVLPINDENLMTKVRLVSEEGDSDEVDEELTEFFSASDLSNMVVEGRRLVLEGRNTAFEFELVDFGTFDVLSERNAVLSQALRLDEAAQHNVSRISRLLGDLWLVEHLQDHVVLSTINSEKVALLRV